MVAEAHRRAFVARGGVDADGEGGTLSGVITGEFDGPGFDRNDDFRGVAVQAESSEDVFVVGASAGVGLYVGLAGAISVSVIDSDTMA